MKVSVLMITYNQEKFIAQAIDSILMQQVNFDYEIVIGEDCSTDSTRDIVISYKKKYQDKIRLLLPEKNLGMQKNFIQTFMACQGEYIAILEGDDYWTDAYKLQKQVDFLESHPETALCYGNVVVVYEDGSDAPHDFFMTEPKSKFSHRFPEAIATLEDIILGNFIPTASVMFRSELLKTMPEWMMTIPYVDWPLFTLIAEHGNLAYLNDMYGVYRVHSGGIYSSISWLDKLKKAVYVNEVIDQHFNFRYKKKLETAKILLYSQMVEILLNEKKHNNARSYVKEKLLNSLLFENSTSKRRLLRMYLKVSLPNAYSLLKFCIRNYVKILNR